jgi:ketosteroid isomerase-like protein
MSVNELQTLAQQFADAFDQRDLQPILDMLSEDVEVFDHVPYRFDGKALFAKYLNEVIASLASASFGFRQPSCRVYCVQSHDILYKVSRDILYTPALVPPARREQGWRGRRWTWRNRKCGLWWRRHGGRSR